MSTLDPAIGAPYIALCVVVLVEVVVLTIAGLCGKLQLPFKKTVGFILFFLGLGLIFRIITVSLWLSFYDVTADIVFNRFTWLAFTIAFIILVFGWAEAVHSKIPPPATSFVPVLKWTLLGICVAISLFQIITITVYLVLRDPNNPAATPNGARTAYDANIWCYVAVQVALSFSFLVYGIILLWRLNQGPTRSSLVVMDEKHMAKRRSTMLKLVSVMFVIFALFTVRGIVFMLRPAWNITIASGVFYTFAYILPETLCALVELFVLISTHDSKKRASRMAETELDSTTESTASAMSSSGISKRPLLEHSDSATTDTEEQFRKLDQLIDDAENEEEDNNHDIIGLDDEHASERQAIEEEAARKAKDY